MKKSSSMFETRERRAAWLWRNSPHCSFNDTGSCRRHFSTLLMETPPIFKELRTQSTRSSYFSSNCFISSFRLSGWACIPSTSFNRAWEGSCPALGESSGELALTLLGWMSGVGGGKFGEGVGGGGVRGAASGRGVSWPNMEKGRMAWPPAPRLEGMWLS